MTDGLLRRCGHGNASPREEMQAGKRKIPLMVAVAMVATNYLGNSLMRNFPNRLN